MRGDVLEMMARERLGMPDTWCAYSWACKPGGGSVVTHYVEVVGMIAPLKTKGKNKGDHNWSAGDKDTEKTVYITPAEHAAWCVAWEAKTGRCIECIGTGKVIASISVVNGTTYRECPKCKGTKLAALVAP